MARNRTISPDFWTMEAVIDCPAMTRLLFIGLWNFADDFGVQPLRPRTIRMQVFPGDTMENDSVRAMIEELAARGLVRIYTVDGVEYVAVPDWTQMQRVGKRAKRRYPPDPSVVPEADAASNASAQTTENHSNAAPPPSPEPSGMEDAWRDAIGARWRAVWPHAKPLESVERAETMRWIGRWIAEGCDLEHDVLAMMSPIRRTPPTGLHDLADSVRVRHSNRLARQSAA